MTGALVIFVAMVVIGVLLYITDVTYFRHHHSPDQKTSASIKPNEEKENQETPEICCGLHLVCEKTGLSPRGEEIVYYDDEELDRFIGRNPNSYSYEETEEFRDVLMTLLPEDVAGWARSITQRGIELPTDVREELLMIVAELRPTS